MLKKEIKIFKIDTQGTELKILKQGENLFKQGYFDIVFIDVMVVEKYEGQHNYLEILEFLNSCGFIIYNITSNYRELNKNFVDASTNEFGHTTEYDFTLVHKNRLERIESED